MPPKERNKNHQKIEVKTISNAVPKLCFVLAFPFFCKRLAWSKIHRHWNAQVQDKSQHRPKNSPWWPNIRGPKYPNICLRSTPCMGENSTTLKCQTQDKSQHRPQNSPRRAQHEPKMSQHSPKWPKTSPVWSQRLLNKGQHKPQNTA